MVSVPAMLGNSSCSKKPKAVCPGVGHRQEPLLTARDDRSLQRSPVGEPGSPQPGWHRWGHGLQQDGTSWGSGPGDVQRNWACKNVCGEEITACGWRREMAWITREIVQQEELPQQSFSVTFLLELQREYVNSSVCLSGTRGELPAGVLGGPDGVWQRRAFRWKVYWKAQTYRSSDPWWVPELNGIRLQATQRFGGFSSSLCRATSLSVLLFFSNLLLAFFTHFHFSTHLLASFSPAVQGFTSQAPWTLYDNGDHSLWSPGCDLRRIEG